MATYYFSASGNDSNSGTSIGSPWRTIAKFNSFFSSLNPGDSVLFNRGDTFAGAMIISRSGSLGSEITIGAYGSGAKPIITGLVTQSSWSSIGSDLYTSVLASAFSTCNIVMMDGDWQIFGKYPKGDHGYITVTGHSGTSPQTINGSIGAVPDCTGGEVVWRAFHWVLWRGKITAQTSTAVTCTPDPSTSGGPLEAPQVNYGFFFQNHPSICTVLGEWAYNGTSHLITMNFAGSAPGSHTIQGPSVQDLVTIGGRSYIIFDNIQFIGANTNLFNFNGSSNNQITNCDLKGAGVYGIFLNGNSNNCQILNTTIDSVGSVAVHCSNSSTPTIQDCTITKIGRWAGMGGSGEGQYWGILNAKNSAIVERNNLSDIGMNGITWQGTNNLIRNNCIDTFGMIKDDGGGLYAGGQNNSGTIVTGNIVTNGIGAHAGTPDTEERIHGFYMDDGGSNCEVAFNTFALNGGGGINLHNAHEMNIHNNTCYDNDIAAIIYFNDGNITANISLADNIFFSKTASELLHRSSGGTVEPSTFFSFADRNHWCRPINENNTFTKLTPSFANYNLASWKTYTGKEATSTVTPVTISDVSFLRFEKNCTDAPVTISLDGNTYIDSGSTTYSGSTELAAYRSLVLILTAEGSGSGESGGGESGSGFPSPDITSITINFTLCDPAPLEGYNIVYRVVGDHDYIDAGFFTSSPAVIPVDYPDGTHFEGLIKSDCGDVPWNV